MVVVTGRDLSAELRGALMEAKESIEDNGSSYLGKRTSSSETHLKG